MNPLARALRRLRLLLEEWYDETWFRVAGLLAVVGLASALGLALALLGPDRPSDGLAGLSVERAGVEAARLAEQREIDALRERFLEAVRARPATPEALAIARQARDRQRALVDRSRTPRPEDRVRVEELERLVDDHESRPLAQAVETDRAAAEAAATAGDSDQAILLFRRAAASQRDLNDRFPRSPARDVTRPALLERRVQQVRMAPRLAAAAALEQEAEARIAAGDWLEGAERLQASLDAGQRILDEFGDTALASSSDVERRRRRLQEIDADRLAREVETAVAEALAAAAAEDWLRAGARYLEARQKQRTINRDHPRHRTASEARADDLERDRQTVLSEEQARALRAAEARIAVALAGDGRGVADEAARALEILEDLRLRFPQSRHLDEDRFLRVRFLALLAGDLPFVLERLRAELLPVPGISGVKLSRTEIPQRLYDRLLGGNPSRQRGETLPVESVNLEEAREFCRRAGWLLGRRVRLPRREEFLAAVGDLRYAPLLRWTWNTENSGGQARDVGTSAPFATGFHDLLGNVAEWVEPTSGRDGTFVFGGSFQSSPEELLDRPLTARPPAERGRHVGFRIAVETD